MPWLRGLDRGEERLRLVVDWRDPAVQRVFRLMIPVTLGLGLINVNALIDTWFASRFVNADLAPTAIQKAFLVYMLPQGMFSVAIATVLFPSLARLASRGDLAASRTRSRRGFARSRSCSRPRRSSARFSPSRSSGSCTSAAHWHPNQTPVVAGALAAFSAGLVFNGAMLMLNRTFFSLQSTGFRLPSRSGTWC